jgi:hypothetical protein
MDLREPPDPDVQRLLDAGWTQVPYWGTLAWQDKAKKHTVQNAKDALRYLSEEEQNKEG